MGSTSAVPNVLIGWAAVPALGLETTTGGGNLAPVLVTSVGDLVTHAESSSPAVIRVRGRLELSSALLVSSNKTIIGDDENATIVGQINIDNKSNVIIRYLTITNPAPLANGDGIQIISGSHHVWVDHCTIFDTRDGALDNTRQTDYITVSWTKFYYTNNWGHNFACLISNSDTDEGPYRITWHHNWWSTLVDQRQPNVKHGYSHLFNNYWDSVGSSYCTDVRLNSQLLSENNYYDGVHNPLVRRDSTTRLKTVGNIFNKCTGDSYQGNDAVDALPYAGTYTLDPAGSVPSIVKAGAGNKGTR